MRDIATQFYRPFIQFDRAKLHKKLSPVVGAHLVLSLAITCLAQSSGIAPIRNIDDLRTALFLLNSADGANGKLLLNTYTGLIQPGLCLRLIVEGEAAYKRGDVERCIFFYELAVEAVDLLGVPNLLRFGVPHRLGACYYEKGLIKNAVEAHLRFKKMCEEINNSGEMVFLLADLGLFYRAAEDYDTAERYAFQGERLSLHLKTISDQGTHAIADWGLNSCWHTLGVVMAHRGEHQIALTFFQKALSVSLEIAQKTPDSNENVVWGLVAVGEMHWALGDYGIALRNTEEAIVIGRTLHRKVALVSALTNLGMIFESQGEYIESIRILMHAAEVAANAADQRGLARATYNRGICYLRMNDHAEALIQFEEALKIADQLESTGLVLMIKE